MGWMNFAQAGASPPPPPASEQYVPPSPEPNPDQDEPVDLLMVLMPWGIAVMFHLGVLMLAFFISWSVQTAVEEEEVIIPEARLSATPGAPLSQRQTTSIARSSSLSTSTSSSVRRSLSSSNRSSTTPTQLSSTVDLSSVAIGAGAGSAGGGSSDAFSDGIQGEAGMKATMYGSGGNARRIVYMIDASGSLIGTLPFVIAELKRSIGELSDKQEFTVIFFQGEEAKEVPPRGLKRATQENKQRIIQWIDIGSGNIVPMNLSNPVKAITLALQYRPQLMFLLSDNITGEGRYEVDQRMLLAEIAKANRGNTKINTFQFLYPDPLTRAGLKGTMELISETSGGIYKYLDGRELEIE